MITNPSVLVRPGRGASTTRLRVCAMLFCAGLSGLASAGAAPALQPSFSPPGISNEFSATPRLEWNAEAGVTYVIETTTNLADRAAWRGTEVAIKQVSGLIQWTPPEAPAAAYYRLVTQPALYDVQPTFVDSSDTNAALYLVGQLFPSNAIAVINGHDLSMEQDSTGVWRVSLNGLPPGEPVLGAITIIDPATSHVVATLTVQSPLLFGTALSPEHLQGPAEGPPASPGRKEFKGHVTLLKAFDDGSDDSASARHTKSGHVTLLKAFDDGSDEGQANARHTKTGHVTLLKAFDDGSDALALGRHTKSGHVTLLKAFDDGSDAGESARMASSGGKKEFKGHVTLLKREMAPGGEGDDCDDGNDLEICPATGELRCQETDLVIPGVGVDFVWTRSYRSRTGSTTAQGAGWDFSYNVSLAQQSDGTIVLHPGNGRADTFYPTGTNTWTRDEYFCEVSDLNNDGMPDVLFADTGRWLFNPLGTPSGGKLWKIIDRSGNTVTLDYDLNGRLTTIVDDLGRTNTVAYDGLNRVASVTDFSGRVVRYEYDGNGDLVSVVSPPVAGTPTGNDFPGGITNRYTYTSGNLDDRLNHNLASCTDGKGQTWLQVTYQPTTDAASLDFDAVDNYYCGSTSHLRRYPQTPSPTNGYAVVKSVCCDGVGNVCELFYDSRQRCVRQLEYTGRSNPELPVTEVDNRPTGKLRVDDPAYYETTRTWNADSLCTGETRPGSNCTECTYQRAFNQNSSRSNHTHASLHNGDLRVLRLRASSGGGDLDGDGVPDIAELAWHFEYDPRFGSPALAARGKKLYVGNLPFRTVDQGWDGTIKGRRFGAGDTSPQSPLGCMRTRINELETILKSFGLLAFAAGGNVGVNEPLPDTTLHMSKVSGSGPGNFAPLDASGNLADRGRYKGWDGTVKGSARAKIITDRDTGRSKGFGFVTSLTDPRGGGFTAEYSEHGDFILWRMRKRPEILYQAAYNARGQLTAVTNAPDANSYRSVDTISYYDSGPQAGYPQSIAIDEPGVHLASSFEYDSRGNLTRCVDPRGNDWLFTYNALDRCVARQTPATSFGERIARSAIYDENGNVVQSRVELRDETGAFVRNVLCDAEYDPLDRCVAVAEQVSAGVFLTNRFEYDANGCVTAESSPLACSGADASAVARYEYDERGLLFREIAAPGTSSGGTNEFSYDVNGNLSHGSIGLGSTGVAGTVTKPGRPMGAKQKAWLCSNFRVAYDGFDRPVGLTNEMGNVIRCAYDRNGNLTLLRCYGELTDAPGSADNRLLAETRCVYDEVDRCVQQQDSFFDVFTELAIGDGQSTITCAYAPNGACTSVTDDNGHTTSYAYDSAGRLASLTSPRSDVLQFSYDAADNVTQVTSVEVSDLSAQSQTFYRQYTYDPLNRCVSSADNVGNTNRYDYDSLDRCVRATDPKGQVSWATYDDLGRCTSSIADLDGDGIPDLVVDAQSRWTYDDNSRCVACTDDSMNTTVYAYDSVGHCVAVTNADGTALKLIWSPRSNLVGYEDPNGTTVTNTYDAANRIVHRDIATRNFVAATTTFEAFGYDGLSRCISAANDASTTSFAYDSLGDCVSATEDGLASHRSFDGVGNCLSVIYPGGRVVTYTYDPADELATLSSSPDGKLPPVVLATYSYDGPGRVARVSRANGTETRLQWDGRVSPPNAADDYGWRQVAGISHQTNSGGTIYPIDRRLLAYDRNQNKILRAQVAAFAQGQELSTNVWTYDALNREQNGTLFRGNSMASKSYVLDGKGNRQIVFADGVAQPYVMDPAIPPADFEMDQYTTTPFASQTYDDDGNLVGRVSASDELQFVYDYADRLVAVTNLTSGMPEFLAAYAYDALGRRISKTVSSGGLPPATTRYLFGDEGHRIREARRSGVVDTSFVYGDNSSDGESSSGGSACPLFASTAGGLDYYLHPDDLGNVLALSAADGSVLERCDYDDYGQPTFLTSEGVPTGASSSAVGNPFLFQAMEWDAETALYCKEFSPAQDQLKGSPRHLTVHIDPLTGRCLTRATACPDGTCNPYDIFDSSPWTLKKEEGGRHTPFHNKLMAASVTGNGKYYHTGHVTLLK